MPTEGNNKDYKGFFENVGSKLFGPMFTHLFGNKNKSEREYSGYILYDPTTGLPKQWDVGNMNLDGVDPKSRDYIYNKAMPGGEYANFLPSTDSLFGSLAKGSTFNDAYLTSAGYALTKLDEGQANYDKNQAADPLSKDNLKAYQTNFDYGVFMAEKGGFVDGLKPVQTAEGEYVLLPNGEITKVASKKKHSKMDEDKITDVLPEGAYIFATSYKVDEPKGDADVTLLASATDYTEGETPEEPYELKLSEFWSKPKMTPAELAQSVLQKFPLSNREKSGIDTKTDAANKNTRLQVIPALLQHIEGQSPKRKSNELVPKMGGGGPVSGRYVEDQPWWMDLLGVGSAIPGGIGLLSGSIYADQNAKTAQKAANKFYDTSKGYLNTGTGISTLGTLAQDYSTPKKDFGATQAYIESMPTSVSPMQRAYLENKAFSPMSDSTLFQMGSFQNAATAALQGRAIALEKLNEGALNIDAQNRAMQAQKLQAQVGLADAISNENLRVGQQAIQNKNFGINQLSQTGVNYYNQLSALDKSLFETEMAIRAQRNASMQQNAQNQANMAMNVLGMAMGMPGGLGGMFGGGGGGGTWPADQVDAGAYAPRTAMQAPDFNALRSGLQSAAGNPGTSGFGDYWKSNFNFTPTAAGTPAAAPAANPLTFTDQFYKLPFQQAKQQARALGFDTYSNMHGIHGVYNTRTDAELADLTPQERIWYRQKYDEFNPTPDERSLQWIQQEIAKLTAAAPVTGGNVGQVPTVVGTTPITNPVVAPVSAPITGVNVGQVPIIDTTVTNTPFNPVVDDIPQLNTNVPQVIPTFDTYTRSFMSSDGTYTKMIPNVTDPKKYGLTVNKIGQVFDKSGKEVGFEDVGATNNIYLKNQPPPTTASGNKNNVTSQQTTTAPTVQSTPQVEAVEKPTSYAPLELNYDKESAYAVAESYREKVGSKNVWMGKNDKNVTPVISDGVQDILNFELKNVGGLSGSGYPTVLGNSNRIDELSFIYGAYLPNTMGTDAEKLQQIDFSFDTGKDARVYAYQEYLRANDPKKMNAEGMWEYTNKPPKDVLDFYMSIPAKERYKYLKEGRRWYYKTYSPENILTWRKRLIMFDKFNK